MKTEALFDKLYGAKEEFLNILKMPLARKELRRKFETAFDDTLRKIDTAESKIHDLHAKCHQADLNDLLKCKQEIDNAHKLQEWLREEHLLMFGKAIQESDES